MVCKSVEFAVGDMVIWSDYPDVTTRIIGHEDRVDDFGEGPFTVLRVRNNIGRLLITAPQTVHIKTKGGVLPFLSIEFIRYPS